MTHIPYAFFPMDFMFEKQGIDAVYETMYMLQREAFSGEFTLYDINVTTRVFNHWLNYGLLPDEGLEKQGNLHQLKFTEYIWVKLIKELREFGMPLEKIKLVKEQLYTPIDFKQLLSEYLLTDRTLAEKELSKRYSTEESKTIYSFILELSKHDNKPSAQVGYLEYLIMANILQKQEVRILIDVDGKVVAKIGEEPNEEIERYKKEIEFDTDSFISISLIKFFKKFVMNQKNLAFVSKNMILNDNELFILSLIRDGKAKAITIKFEEDKPRYIEMDNEKKVEIESRLSEVLLRKQYQELVIKTQDGDIAYTNVKTRIKLKS